MLVVIVGNRFPVTRLSTEHPPLRCYEPDLAMEAEWAGRSRSFPGLGLQGEEKADGLSQTTGRELLSGLF